MTDICQKCAHLIEDRLRKHKNLIPVWCRDRDCYIKQVSGIILIKAKGVREWDLFERNEWLSPKLEDILYKRKERPRMDTVEEEDVKS